MECRVFFGVKACAASHISSAHGIELGVPVLALPKEDFAAPVEHLVPIFTRHRIHALAVAFRGDWQDVSATKKTCGVFPVTTRDVY